MTINRDDLIEFKNDIKEHINNKVSPVVYDVSAIKSTLYGKEGRGGIVGDVRDIKASARLVKWIAGGGFGTAAAAWFKEFLK